jgi:hypothetical protein
LRRHEVGLVTFGVALTAYAVRLSPLLLGAGLGSFGRYDDGVYYSAADALTFGRTPYRDFVLLHPPGITLVLAPFALLGRVTSDPFGMALARLAFIGVGALNAALVTLIGYRWHRRAAITAGLAYACWLPAVYGEQSTLLEPIGTTALLVALLLLLKTGKPPTVRAEVLAGAVLGLAVTVKIWYVASWAVTFCWQLAWRRWAAALRIAAAGTVALAAVVLPFAALAPGRMFDMVIRDQLLRAQGSASRLARVASILGVKGAVVGHHQLVVAATGVAAVLLLSAVVVCLIESAGRVLVAILAVNMLVLLAGPSYFEHYAELTAAPVALVVGAAVGLAGRARIPGWVPRIALSAVVIAVAASALQTATRPQGSHVSGALAAAAPAGCIASDDPQILIQMNRLSRDVRAGCPLPVDVTGITYDALCEQLPNGSHVARINNEAWQHYLANYLTSANAFVIARAHSDGLSPDTRQTLLSDPPLRTAAGLTLRQGFGTAPAGDASTSPQIGNGARKCQ